MRTLDWLFGAEFMPHGHCFNWERDVLLLHVVSDLLIALAYYSIPVTLLIYERGRRGRPYGWIYLMFGAFIFACGTTHLFDVYNVWHSSYRLEGLMKLATAAISLATAAALVPIVPKALALPTPEELQRINEELRREIEERRRVEESFRRLVEFAPDAMVIVDETGKIVLVNEEAERLFGYARAEMEGVRVEALVPERLRERHVEHRARFLSTPHRRPMGRGIELFARRKDGSEIPVEVSLGPLEQGRRIAAVVRDISERKAVEAELRSARVDLEHRVAERTGELAAANRVLVQEIADRKRTEREMRGHRDELAALQLKLDAVVRSTPHGLCMLDPAWTIQWVNKSMSRILSPNEESTDRSVGRSFSDFFGSERDFLEFKETAAREIRFGGFCRREVGVPGPWGRRWYDVSAVRLDPRQTATGYVVSVTDVTERRYAETQLRYFAAHDPLTGIANRKRFLEALEEALRDAAWQPKPGESIAVFYLDLDDFKPINDAFGHRVGDQILVSFARRLESALGEGDLAGRLGGDEFAALVRANAGRTPESVRERLRSLLSEPYEADGRRFEIRASVGFAVATDRFADLEKLLVDADQAMYNEKNGRSRGRRTGD